MTAIKRAINEWPSPGIPHYTDNNRGLLIAVHTETEQLYQDTLDITESHFPQTAQGKSLEKVGSLVGVDRRDGESDSEYRLRVQATSLAKHLKPTEDNYTKLAAFTMQTDPVNLSIALNAATVEITVDGDIVSATPFTASEIENILNFSLSPVYSTSIITT